MTIEAPEKQKTKTISRVYKEQVVIHFAGDSGDGIQLIGKEFAISSALKGNDVQTYPDFPSEIRAPIGTIGGVSGFQLCFSENDIHTPGDVFDILVALNPAALKLNIKQLQSNGILLVDSDKFTKRDLAKVGLGPDILTDGTLDPYKIIKVPITSLTLKAVEVTNLNRAKSRKCKNMFALGFVYCMYDRSIFSTQEWIRARFKKMPDILEANIEALKAGFNYAKVMEVVPQHFKVEKANLLPGTYRQVTGNQAIALGCLAACNLTNSDMLVSGYPITPATDILHLVASYAKYGIGTFQAEDEIAAMGATVGAAFGGKLALTCTSGPGMDLKGEMLGLGVMAELPMVVVNVQRAGPSTGMPTKVEQSDLFSSLFGRHGESPLPVLAPTTPQDAFNAIVDAYNIALKYMTPVVVLSDTYLANSSEPWKIPDINQLPKIAKNIAKSTDGFSPYNRDPKTLSRNWAVPGMKGFEHRIGGLEKSSQTGNISTDPENHQKMINFRKQKVENVAKSVKGFETCGKDKGKLLVIGWGSTWGAIRTSVENLNKQGIEVGGLQIRLLNPLSEGIAAILEKYENIVVAELNSGQLSQILRAKFLKDIKSITKVKGKPFMVGELTEELLKKIN